ncbi:hypothetical protein BDF21DRAFT_373362 [Thamnidium elegans]|nr:hypothetical protein BDF21DRAFT_373362 [Thamnidium elegans]
MTLSFHLQTIPTYFLRRFFFPPLYTKSFFKNRRLNTFLFFFFFNVHLQICCHTLSIDALFFNITFFLPLFAQTLK